MADEVETGMPSDHRDPQPRDHDDLSFEQVSLPTGAKPAPRPEHDELYFALSKDMGIAPAVAPTPPPADDAPAATPEPRIPVYRNRPPGHEQQRLAFMGARHLVEGMVAAAMAAIPGVLGDAVHAATLVKLEWMKMPATVGVALNDARLASKLMPATIAYAISEASDLWAQMPRLIGTAVEQAAQLCAAQMPAPVAEGETPPAPSLSAVPGTLADALAGVIDARRTLPGLFVDGLAAAASWGITAESDVSRTLAMALADAGLAAAAYPERLGDVVALPPRKRRRLMWVLGAAAAAIAAMLMSAQLNHPSATGAAQLELPGDVVWTPTPVPTKVAATKAATSASASSAPASAAAPTTTATATSKATPKPTPKPTPTPTLPPPTSFAYSGSLDHPRSTCNGGTPSGSTCYYYITTTTSGPIHAQVSGPGVVVQILGQTGVSTSVTTGYVAKGTYTIVVSDTGNGGGGPYPFSLSGYHY